MPLHGTPTNESRSIQDPIYHWIGTRPVFEVKCDYCQETKKVHRIYTAKKHNYCCFDHKMKGIRKYNDFRTLQFD